jgi:hypothetical protein
MSKMTDYLEVQLRRSVFRDSAVTVRANTTAYALGDRVQLGTSDLNIYEAIVAGTSAGSPPSFNTNLGDTTVDGSVTWLTLKHGYPKRPIFVALVRATRGFSNQIRNTAVSIGDTVIPALPNGRIYRVSTAGTTGSGEPAFPTTDGATVADGTAVWTEMTPDLEAFNANVTEVSGGSYARVARAPADANWSAPDATGGVTANVADIQFPDPTGTWGVVSHFIIVDRLTGGNAIAHGALNNPITVTSGSAAVKFPAGQLSATWQ